MDTESANSSSSRRSSFQLHTGRRLEQAASRPAPVVRSESSPLKQAQAVAGAMFVVSMAACWIAVASTVTAPLLAAGELLSRAARERPA